MPPAARGVNKCIQLWYPGTPFSERLCGGRPASPPLLRGLRPPLKDFPRVTIDYKDANCTRSRLQFGTRGLPAFSSQLYQITAAHPPRVRQPPDRRCRFMPTNRTHESENQEGERHQSSLMNGFAYPVKPVALLVPHRPVPQSIPSGRREKPSHRMATFYFFR